MTVHLTERRAPAPAASVVRPRGPRTAAKAPRVRRLAMELARFSVVGGSGVAVNVLVFNLVLHGLGRPPMAATVTASCVAMATNYLGFRFFAYRDRASRTRGQIALFFAFSGLGVLMESALFYLGYQLLGMSGPLGSNAAKVLSIVLASAFRFVAYRTWVFQHARSSRERPDGTPSLG
ncbi:GtrA family protein [Streptomyces sp. NPDC007084]|uniref:GtrA family protein n=1 Tax=Streptomyces sp. NPDC007084 TaxID=3154313 RepID=UPI003455EB36